MARVDPVLVHMICAGPEALAELPVDAMLVVLAPPPDASGLEVPSAGALELDLLIRAAAARLAPGGVLLVACSHEDARRALVGGVVGAPGGAVQPPPVERGPSPRIALAAALRTAGLQAQAWYGAFADHVAPRVLAEESLFDDPSGRALTVAFARDPGGHPEPGVRLSRDPTTSLVAALDQGFGVDAAPGLLVLAARSATDLDARRRAGALFLLSSGDRGHAWRRARVLERTDTGWRLRSLRPPAEVRDGLLRGREPETKVVVGRNGEDLLVDALVASGTASARTRTLLGAWWRAATAAMAEPDGSGGWQFDVGLRNFVVDGDGIWHHVDRELTIQSDPRPDVMAWRAIAWALIERIEPLGDLPGVPPGTTVRAACRAVVSAVGLPAAKDTEEVWLAFESDLQARLRPGIEPPEERAALAWLLDRPIVRAGVDEEQFEEVDDGLGQDHHVPDTGTAEAGPLAAGGPPAHDAQDGRALGAIPVERDPVVVQVHTEPRLGVASTGR